MLQEMQFVKSSRYHYGTWKGRFIYLLPADTVAHLMANIRSFNEILSLAEVQGKMPFLKRYLRREETAREISHCGADLDQALTLFSVCIPTVLSTIINRKIRPQFKSERSNLSKVATSIAQNAASNQFQNAAPTCRRP